MKKKKKLIIIIIIAVVVLVGAFLALFFLGLLPFGGGEESASGMDASSMATSGSMSMASSGSMMSTSGSMMPASGSMAQTSDVATNLPPANPERFFEGEYYFQNITGSPLVEIQLAPSGTAVWESNLLGETTLENGETWALPLMLRDLGTTWDLRTTDANGQEMLYTDLNLYENSKFVLTVEGDSPSLRQAP